MTRKNQLVGAQKRAGCPVVWSSVRVGFWVNPLCKEREREDGVGGWVKGRPPIQTPIQKDKQQHQQHPTQPRAHHANVKLLRDSPAAVTRPQQGDFLPERSLSLCVQRSQSSTRRVHQQQVLFLMTHNFSGSTPPLPSVRESSSSTYERDTPPTYERDTTIMGGSFSGPSGLRLEPIKPASHHAYSGGSSSSGFELGGGMPPNRSRRSSQDEIRALLQRTTMALDKIVKIRESMEEFVDFKQFEKAPRRQSRTQSGSQDQQQLTRPGPPSRLSSGPIMMQDHTRTTPASSYGSTVTSSSSEDPLGRSTNSTHSSSSSLGEEDSSDPTEESLSGSSDTQQQQQQDSPKAEEEEEEDDEDRESGNDTFDDSSDSSISMTEVSPLKEARLERLKNIEIAFHEGLPKEFFQAICRFLYSTIEVKTRHSRFNFYKDAFTGSDAIKEMIVNGFAEDQPTAQRFGNVLVRLGFIEHVSRTDDQLHNSKDNFYRFTKALEYDDGDFLSGSPNTEKSRMSITATNYRESVLSRESSGHTEYDFTTATDEVHALATEEVLQIFSRVLLKVFERKNKLLFYKGFVGCFLGAEAVNVIRELRIATSLIDAVLLGQCLLDEGIIEPIATTVTTFQDKYIFYRLTKVRP